MAPQKATQKFPHLGTGKSGDFIQTKLAWWSPS
jgi:hypothetical protein